MGKQGKEVQKVVILASEFKKRIEFVCESIDSSEGSARTPAGRVILFGTIPTTILDTTPVITPPTTQTDTKVIPTEIPIIAPTIPPSLDYTPASHDYSPASDIESDPYEDRLSDHIPAISPFLSSADDTTDSDTLDTPPSPTHGNGYDKKEDLVSKFINEFFPPSRTTNLHNEISNFQQRFDESFHKGWDRYKDLLCACPHHGFTELHQLDTFYNALNPADQDSLNAAAGSNLLERRTQDVLKIIENKSKVRNSRNKSVVSQVKSCDANSNSSSEIGKLTHAVNQQTSAVTTAMTAILKQFQATPPPTSVKAVKETCVTYGGAHPYYQCLAADGNTFPELRDNIQGYVSTAAINYN
nr:reverse transcriptase domain-containing protein [Tanacetum cinerariifolium]